MSPRITKEESKMNYIKPGIYQAEYLGCESAKVKNKNGGEDQVYQHRWKIKDKEGKEVELNELSDQKMTTQNKLGQIVESLMARHVAVKETIELDDLKGRKAMLVIKDRESNGKTYSQITEHACA